MIFLILLFTALMAGFIKTGFGIGGGFFLTPLLALVMSPLRAVGLISPVMLITDVITICFFRGQKDTAQVLLMIPGCICGTVIGSCYLCQLSSSMIETGIGIIAVVFAVIFMLSKSDCSIWNQWDPGAYQGMMISVVAGFASAVAHSGGIILTIYFLAKGYEKERLIATMVNVLLVSDIIKLPLFLMNGFLDGDTVWLVIFFTPILLLGSWMGHKLLVRLNRGMYAHILAVIVLVCGLILLIDPQELVF